LLFQIHLVPLHLGIFVPIEDVKALEEDDDGDDWEPLPVGGCTS
jgi:hypothetical protein